MEGVGARLGRSSTRYGPATVFNGPVRKWKKRWVHLPTSSPASNNNRSQIHNGTTKGNNGSQSHLLLYKWTPITQSQNNNNGENNSGKEETTVALLEEPPQRKFKYIPISVLEEQKNEGADDESAEKVEDEVELIDVEHSEAEPTTPKGEVLCEKPDINDAPMEESQSQDNSRKVCHDLNDSTLDLSLGLMAHDDAHDSGSKANQIR
ncbi:Golgin family A protein [Quillaja saponaria]|uniref:Golgin family A protein n=1 Tax=Quillaja saponaria TaxID=32244 RepID=A0AAD7PUJ0_QUISA|nr:Golgin family A protein [Quillaja saponaria]